MVFATFCCRKNEQTFYQDTYYFDASAKYCGVSLNDAIHQGPKLQEELFKVLIRFRKYPV